MGRTLLLVVLLLGLGPGTTRSQPSPPDTVRCYDLTLRPWRGRGTVGADSLLYAPPSRIRLDTTLRAEYDSLVYRLGEPPGALPSIHEIAFWRTWASGDSLLLSWSTGTAGLSARLGIARGGWNDTLRGQAKTFIDVGGAPRYTADLTAAPVPCDSPWPPEHHNQRPVPSGVALASGDSVRLGEPLDAVSGTEPVENRTKKYLRRPLATPFSGASDVELLPDRNGDVALIRFQLSGLADFEALVDTLAAMHGAPTHRSTHSLSGLRTTLVSWANRTVKLSVHRACPPDRACDVSALLARQRYRIPDTPP